MDPNPGIAARISELVTRHSQAAVARAGGVNESSVFHYQRGRRIPADFCVSLAEGLGVSLNWLLTGTGAPEAGQAMLEAGALGENMERMVRILGALETEAEGALQASPTAARLKRLDDMLKAWHETQQRVNASLLPVSERLVKSIGDAMDRMNLTRAADLKPGLEYLKRFSLPPEAVRRIDLALSRFAFLDLDYEQDFELRQKILWRYLAAGGEDPRRVLEYAFAVVHSAYGIARYHQAVLIADGVLAATALVPLGDAHRLRLRVVRASCLVETGRVQEAVGELSDAIPRLPQTLRDKSWGLYLRTLVLAGAMRVADAFAVIEGYAYPQDDTALFTLAMLDRGEKWLARALKFAEKTGAVHPDTSQPTNWLRVQCLQQSAAGDPAGAVKRWLAAAGRVKPGRQDREALRFHEVALLRVGGREKTARARLRDFWQQWDAGKTPMPAGLFSLAGVYRETLLLEPAASALHARAGVWVRRKLAQGYMYFQPWLGEPG